jgi:hypothetical protein
MHEQNASVAREMSAQHPSSNWSSAYWVPLANHLIVVPLLVLLASALLSESFRACKAAELELPKITAWYFFTIGPAGLVWSGALSVAVAVGAIAIRRRFASILVTSLSLVSGVGFLGLGVFSAFLPLFLAIRQMLPPDRRW